MNHGCRICGRRGRGSRRSRTQRMRVSIGYPSGLCAIVRVTGVIVEVMDSAYVEVGRLVLLPRVGIGVVALVAKSAFIRAIMSRALARPRVVPDIDGVD